MTVRPSRRSDPSHVVLPERGPLLLLLGDVVRLPRAHPCGGDTWLVDRLGADIGLRCRTCGRHVLVERTVLEGRLVAFVERGDPALTAAVENGARDARAGEPQP